MTGVSEPDANELVVSPGTIQCDERIPELDYDMSMKQKEPKVSTPRDSIVESNLCGCWPNGQSMRKDICHFSFVTAKNVAIDILILLTETINLFFGGHFGSVHQFAAVGFANSMQNCFAFYFAYGLNSAFYTVVSTGGGAGETRLCMLYLARGRNVINMFFLLVAPILFYSDEILILLGQDEIMAHHVNEYNRASLIGVWFFLQADASRRFLQSKNHSRFALFIQLFSVLIHPIWCYILVVRYDMGNVGLGYANSITWITQCICLSLYFRFNLKSLGIQSQWLNFWVTKEAWGWKAMINYVRIAVPGSFLFVAQIVYWEIFSIAAGYFSVTQLAAHVSAVTLANVLYMLVTGLCATASFFLGSAMGRQDVAAATKYHRLSLAYGFTILCADAIILSVSAPYLALMITDLVEVQDIMVDLLRIYALSTVPDGMQALFGMFLRVCEYQKLAVSIYIVETLLFTTPLGMILAFVFNWGVKGFWTATVFGTSAGFCVLMYLSMRIDLKEEIQRAKQRIERDGSSDKRRRLFSTSFVSTRSESSLVSEFSRTQGLTGRQISTLSLLVKTTPETTERSLEQP